MDPKPPTQDLDTLTEQLVKATAMLASSFKPLWASWRSGAVPFSHVAQALEGHVKSYAEILGGIAPALEDNTLRPQVIKKAILVSLDMVGVDLPGPDGLYLDAAILAVTYGWRLARARKSTS
jgi:hypothetical protein